MRIIRESFLIVVVVSFVAEVLIATVVVSHLFVYGSGEDRDDFDISTDNFDNKGQMHLDAMFVLIIVDIQHVESFFQFELVYHLHVDLKWAEGSVVLVQVGESASWKIFVVGWSEDEDSFDVIGEKSSTSPTTTNPTVKFGKASRSWTAKQ